MTGQQLKNSILQMAVQGKLVPQDPNDEPASVLLERIRAEKEQLIKEGKIKKEKNPSIIFRGADNLPYEKVGKNEPICIADEVPFEIPDSWEWVRLKNLVKKEIKRGKSPKYTVSSNIQVFAQKCNVKAGGIDMTLAKYLDDTVFPKYPEEECMRDSDIVINSTGNGTLGRIGMFHDSDRINENIIVPDSHVTVIRASEFLSADYIFYVLNYYQTYLEKSCSGSTNQTELKPAVISELFIPVPPVNEQTRIITKLIEALNLSKQYGKKEILLQKYNQDFPEQLKKSILQCAVQGKLVPQDPSDESAAVLLERIRAEKQKLIAEGKIKKDKHESVIFRRDNSHYEKHDSEEICIDDELPFEIPENWCWARLGELCSIVTGRLDANAQTPDGEFAFFTCGREVFKTNTYAFDCDAILLGGNNASGDYKMHRYVGKFNAYQRVYVISGADSIVLDYLYYVITFWLGHLKKNSQGTTTRFIKLGQVTGMLVPFPPYDEQKKILSAIEQLLKQCKRLK